MVRLRRRAPTAAPPAPAMAVLATATSGLEAFSRLSPRPGPSAWRVEVGPLAAHRLAVPGADHRLASVHRDLPADTFTESGLLVHIAGDPVLVVDDEWEQASARALSAAPRPLTWRRLRARRALRRHLERRRRTLAGAREVRYFVFDGPSDTTGIAPWSILITEDGHTSTIGSPAAVADHRRTDADSSPDAVVRRVRLDEPDGFPSA